MHNITSQATGGASVETMEWCETTRESLTLMHKVFDMKDPVKYLMENTSVITDEVKNELLLLRDITKETGLPVSNNNQFQTTLLRTIGLISIKLNTLYLMNVYQTS